MSKELSPQDGGKDAQLLGPVGPTPPQVFPLPRWVGTDPRRTSSRNPLLTPLTRPGNNALNQERNVRGGAGDRSGDVKEHSHTGERKVAA